MKFCKIEKIHNNPNVKGKIYIFSELDFNAHNFKQKKGISKKGNLIRRNLPFFARSKIVPYRKKRVSANLVGKSN